MRRDSSRDIAVLFIVGIIPVLWIGLLIAPFIDEGLVGIVKNYSTMFEKPFNITFCNNSFRSLFILLLIYGILIGLYYSTKGNYRRREEHGSAKWGDSKSIDKKYKQIPESDNKILTQNVKLGLNGKKHRRNLNVLVCRREWSRKNSFLWQT